MNSNSTDDELLRRYLLGQLTAEEEDAVEGRLLAEDELFEQSEAIEADLLAEYARGGLAPAEGERGGQRLASSPQGRERLRRARSLNVLAAREQAAAVLPFVRRAAPFQRPAVRWAAALAAGLLVVAGLIRLTPEPPPPPPPGGGTQKPPVIAETPRAHEVPTPPPALKPAAPPVARAQEPVKAAFQLALTSLRGSESAEKLRVPANAGTVELQISVEGMEDLASFHLTVRYRKAETVKAWTALP